MGSKFGLLINYWTEICTDCDNSAQSQHNFLPVFSFLSVRDMELCVKQVIIKKNLHFIHIT